MSQLAHAQELDSAAVDRALSEVAPLFPLSQFVAVNPFMGFSDATFEAAAERLLSLKGRAPLLAAEEYLRLYEAGDITDVDLSFAGAPDHSSDQLLRALESPADGSHDLTLTALDALEIEVPHAEFRRVVIEEISKWCSTCFDTNQTTWRSPWAESGLYRTFLEGAALDANAEIQGLAGFRAFVAKLPTDARAAVSLLLSEAAPAEGHTEDFIHRALSLVSGWAGYCRFLVREEELRGGTHPALLELLAVRLAFDVGLLRAYPCLRPWVGTVRRRAAREVPPAVLCRFQAAYETAWQRQLATKLAGGSATADAPRPAVQAVFCIDVRSEPLRRQLEVAASDVQTLGFAGFFGFAVSHKKPDGSGEEARCPALLVPACDSADGGASVDAVSVERRTRASTWKAIQNAAASCFSFVETLGIGSAAGLWSLREASKPTWKDRPLPELLDQTPESLQALVDRVQGTLRNMSLTHGFGRLLLLCGHGSHSANNPYASALDCGACGGHAGDVNARLAAATMNRADVRARLAEQGIVIPDDTWVIAGLHDTMTDEVELFDLAAVPASHKQDVLALQRALASASEATRRERAESLGLTSHDATLRTLRRRAEHIGETRPEWGLAGNASLIVAPRATTRGTSLGGRSFLHDYRHAEDTDDSVLKLILSAPVVVASWINLQYYASRVDPESYGAGNKVLHNVVGGFGVFEGNGGDLRVGLPLQSIHDGKRFVHEPRRLSVFIEAPREKLERALTALPDVKKLFDGGWIHLLAIEGGKVFVYAPSGFRELPAAARAAGLAA